MKRPVRIVFACAALLLIGVSAYRLLSIRRGYAESGAYYDAAADRFVSEETERGTEARAEPEVPAGPQTPLTVDFDALRELNGDVVAWLCCPGTVINYPVAQGRDNKQYLRTLLNGKRNNAGTLFLHCKNDPLFADLNSIIYGHHMKDRSMFGTLVNYKRQAYYDAHPAFWLLTPEQDYRLDLIAGYVTRDDDFDTYGLYDTKEQLAGFVNAAMERSTFKSGFDVAGLRNIVTLSTCSYEFRNARYVVLTNLTPVPPQQ